MPMTCYFCGHPAYKWRLHKSPIVPICFRCWADRLEIKVEMVRVEDKKS